MKISLKHLLLGLGVTLAVGATVRGDPPPRVVVVGIDVKTQKRLGPHPSMYWARHPGLIRNLNAAGVRAIAFDQSFPYHPARVAELRALAEAAKNSRAPVTLAIALPEIESGEPRATVNAEELLDPQIGHGVSAVLREFVPKGRRGRSRERRRRASDPAGALWVTLSPDRPSLVEETLSRGGLVSRDRLNQLGVIETGEADRGGRPVRTHFIRPELERQPLTLSYIDLLDSRFRHPGLEGAIVFVGMTAGSRYLRDRPAPSRQPGLERVPQVFLHAGAAKRVLSALRNPTEPPHSSSGANPRRSSRSGIDQALGREQQAAQATDIEPRNKD